MRQSMNLPISAAIAAAYGGWDGVQAACAQLGCDGIEAIWAGEEIPQTLPQGLAIGYHLTFFPDWLDFYREDKAALLQKYGTEQAVSSFYGGSTPETLLALYRADLRRAQAAQAQYVVFHVSDVSVEEGYTYRWLHSDEAVIDASAEIINLLLQDVPPTFDFLVENQWWPGFTFTDPQKTARLLDAIDYPRKGIVLDTGHLMNTNPALRTQREGLAYIHRMLDAHGSLCDQIYGMHLHQSLSGAYVRANTGALPQNWPRDPLARFAESYGHILQIDRHRPWTEPAVYDLLERVSPRYVTHELAAADKKERHRRLRCQMRAIAKGAAQKHADGRG